MQEENKRMMVRSEKWKKIFYWLSAMAVGGPRIANSSYSALVCSPMRARRCRHYICTAGPTDTADGVLRGEYGAAIPVVFGSMADGGEIPSFPPNGTDWRFRR